MEACFRKINLTSLIESFSLCDYFNLKYIVQRFIFLKRAAYLDSARKPQLDIRQLWVLWYAGASDVNKFKVLLVFWPVFGVALKVTYKQCARPGAP
jgi:hypothetical protein